GALHVLASSSSTCGITSASVRQVSASTEAVAGGVLGRTLALAWSFSASAQARCVRAGPGLILAIGWNCACSAATGSVSAGAVRSQASNANDTVSRVLANIGSL